LSDKGARAGKSDKTRFREYVVSPNFRSFRLLSIVATLS